MKNPAARLVIAWCTLFVVGTDLFVVSPLLPLIGDRFDLPPAQAELSVAVFAVSYMICAPLLGRIADRAGRRLMVSRRFVGLAAANLMTTAAPSLLWLLAARVVAGAITASVSPSICANRPKRSAARELDGDRRLGPAVLAVARHTAGIAGLLPDRRPWQLRGESAYLAPIPLLGWLINYKVVPPPAAGRVGATCKISGRPRMAESRSAAKAAFEA